MEHADVLVYDVGTSSLKLVLYAQNGQIVRQQSISYDYQTPHPDWAEIDPAVWANALWEGLEAFARDGLLKGLRAISGTGQMHSGVLLDEAGEALSPCILWLDRRAEQETLELVELFKLPPYMLNTTYTLTKIAWLNKHRPDVLKKARRLLWPKDYLRYLLTGTAATDPTEGVGAAMLDWSTGEWAADRLISIGCDPNLLPPILASDAVAGSILPEIAARYGIPEDVTVFTGYGDMIALLGGAPHEPGRLVYSLGSSSMFFAMVDEANKTAPHDSLYTLELGGYHLFGGVSSTTGASLMWFFENVYQQGTLPEMAEAAWTASPGCDGLVFLPYLAGERSPYWSDRIAGGFYGARLQHKKQHFARAVLEGVAYSVRHAIDLYRESGVTITEIALAAGGVRTPGWAQLICDVCGLPVSIYAAQDTVTKVVDAMCRSKLYGGELNTVLLESFMQPQRLTPDAAHSADYEKSYARYRRFSKFAADCD